MGNTNTVSVVLPEKSDLGPPGQNDIINGTTYGTIFGTYQAYTGYKKLLCRSIQTGRYVYSVAKLDVPKGATVVRPRLSGQYPFVSDKMRTNIARTVDVKAVAPDETIDENDCHSIHSLFFKYPFGQYVMAPLNTSQSDVCTHGLHFFATEREATNYQL